MKTKQCQNCLDQRDAHVLHFGPWLNERGWSQFYNPHNWVKTGVTHPEFGVPCDIAVMLELGVAKAVLNPITGRFAGFLAPEDD